ncbi:zinc finger protein 331-like [Wyeomyia smithii]|uniref:zinc finger protein 331-like n=1 Tax=Wyeomyia smithii TaxID=174621 RepID=UPI002467CF61|nr:zinc finger protein 331-like [Wyeomyia smithii]
MAHNNANTASFVTVQIKQERSDSQATIDVDLVTRCRLCLRSVSQSTGVPVTKAHISTLQIILKQLGNRNETWSHICIICKDLLDIILDFRTAALQANDILLTEKMKLDRFGYCQSDQLMAVSHCREMVRAHRNKIEATFNGQQSNLNYPTRDAKHTLSETETDEHASENDVPLKDSIKDSTREGTAFIIVQKRGRKPKEQPEFMPQLCDFCGKRVCGESAESHKNQHLGIRPYPCPIAGCDLAFHGRYNRLRHVKRMHGEKGVEVHDCHLCGKNIRGPSRALKYHLQRHEQNQRAEKAFICQVCGKGFTLQRYLTQHSIVHSGEFPHKCGYCGKKFNNKWGMRTHEKNIHEKRKHAPSEHNASSSTKPLPNSLDAEN